MYDPDFKKMIFEGYILVSVNVLYTLPDHSLLVNEFFWQTLDVKPSYPRVNRFLKFWRREIDAKIKEVIISDSGSHLPTPTWKNGIIMNLDS